MQFIKKILKNHDLPDDLVDNIYSDIEDSIYSWYEKQSSELTKELLRKENRIRQLEINLKHRRKK